MSMDKVKVAQFFSHVIVNCTCKDITRLIDNRSLEAAPLLSCVMSGIDTLGGMILGFEKNNSALRSKHFLKEILHLSEKQADFMYSLVRCGVAHEGIPKSCVYFFVNDDRPHKGVFLYKDGTNAIWLNVTELARTFVEVVREISRDIDKHLSHYPEADEKVNKQYADAANDITLHIDSFTHDARKMIAHPTSTFPPPYLHKMKLGGEET